MDITNFFNNFLDMIVSFFSEYYSILDSITFGNVSLLGYCITLLILSVVVPMVITLTKSGLRTSKRSYRERNRERREGSGE